MSRNPANEDETDESTPRVSRRRALQLGILSATTGLAGCGGDGDDTDEPTDTEEEMSETESVVTNTDMNGTDTDMNGTATETETETATDTETETETETDTSTPTPSEPTQELRLHWPLDSDATDASGNGYDAATIEGSPTYGADGKVGEAVDLKSIEDDDSANDYIGIKLDDYDDFEVDTSDFTVAWWHYPRSAVDYNQEVGGRDPVNWEQWQFNARDAGGLDVGFDFENGDRFSIREEGALQLDTWQHIAFTYDGTDAVLYMNGSVARGPTSMDNRDPLAKFALAEIDGRIDDVRIYGGALSAGEVKYLFNLGS